MPMYRLRLNLFISIANRRFYCKGRQSHQRTVMAGFEEDWDFSAEDLELLEQDAMRKISERKSSSTTASASCQPSSSSHISPHASASLHTPCQASPSKTSLESRYGGAEVSSRLLDDTSRDTNKFIHQGDFPQISVRLFYHCTGFIAAKFPYNQILVQAFHKIPKASWKRQERLWMFPLSSLKLAEEVLKGVNGVNVEFQSLDPLVCRALAATNAAPDLRELYVKIPSSMESKLLPFQREGVRFVLQHGGRALLADEMGLGKTLQALAVASCLSESWPVLVLTPSSLRLQWASMIQHWLGIPAEDILVVLSQSESNRSGFKTAFSKVAIRLDGTFNIVSYDAVPKLQKVLLSSAFKIVIADESHFLKNAQAKRTSASVPILQKANYAILLSGTPALSRPIELFKQLEALHPDVYKNVHEYGNLYCKGGVFGLYQGSSNHDELHNLMKGTVMIRRLKNDVLSELPAKRRQQVYLDLNKKDLKEMRTLFLELEAVRSEIQSCNSDENFKALEFTQKNLINKIYNDSAEVKIPAVLDYISTVIEETNVIAMWIRSVAMNYKNAPMSLQLLIIPKWEQRPLLQGSSFLTNTQGDCKFLVFAHHQTMIEALYQYFLKKKVGCIKIDGSTPTTSRQTLVSQFQENPEIKAAILSIRAGGVGLTLTAASTVIFAELSWTPGDLIQAEDRAHRIGQVTSVNIYYLLANETVDDIIWDVVQSKLENLGQVLDGELNYKLEVEASSQTSTTAISSSPEKQKTLDSFLKRCPNVVAASPSKSKVPKYC